MKSITHGPVQNTSPRIASRTSSPPPEQESDQIRGFHYDSRRAALGYDYLRRKWLPREGPLFYAFIQVMRSHCYYNAQTGEIRESCYPKVETIAKECGVNPATIHRLIQRDKTTGEFVSKNAEALKRFMKVQPRWLYDPKVGHKTQRSSVYLVALDDPPVPEDEHLVEEKEAELAALLTMERVRQQRQVEGSSDFEAEPTDLHFASQDTLAKCESVMSRKMQDKTLPLTITSKNNVERTSGGRCSADWSIGNQENEEKALVGDEPAEIIGEQPSNRATRSSSPGSSKGTKRQRVHPLAQVYPQTGEAVHQALLDLGGSNPDGGVQTILEALAEVAAPPERMQDLFDLGLRRLEQQQELVAIPNPTGYLIGIMRNVAVEGMLKGWNVAQMWAEDEEKHAQTRRHAVHVGNRLLTSDGNSMPLEEESTFVALESVAPDLSMASEPLACLPGEVEVAEVAMVATWQDYIPDPRDSKPRAVSMLWGFARDAMRDRLNFARKTQLEALTPKWDMTRPRTLLVLCDTIYAAKVAELHLRREIEPQIGKLLSDFFDEIQVVYAPLEREGGINSLSRGSLDEPDPGV